MAQANKWKRHLTAADKRAKVIIEACVEAGAEIVSLPDAPRFRYTPRHMLVDWKGEPVDGGKRGDSFTPAHEPKGRLGPSARGTIACGKGNPLKLKTWSPKRLDMSPQYTVPMRGDCEELRKARYAWQDKGDPKPLRAYLAKLAQERREEALKRDREAAEQLVIAWQEAA